MDEPTLSPIRWLSSRISCTSVPFYSLVALSLSGGPILLDKYCWTNIAGQILPDKYWWTNIDGQNTARKKASRDFGLKIWIKTVKESSLWQSCFFLANHGSSQVATQTPHIWVFSTSHDDYILGTHYACCVFSSNLKHEPWLAQKKSGVTQILPVCSCSWEPDPWLMIVLPACLICFVFSIGEKLT